MKTIYTLAEMVDVLEKCSNIVQNQGHAVLAKTCDIAVFETNYLMMVELLSKYEKEKHEVKVMAQLLFDEEPTTYSINELENLADFCITLKESNGHLHGLTDKEDYLGDKEFYEEQLIELNQLISDLLATHTLSINPRLAQLINA